MGMYDTVEFKNQKGETSYIQFKNSECLGRDYRIDDPIPLNDGVYYAPEGAFFVINEKLIAAFDVDEQFMIDKWGGYLDYPQLENYIQNKINLDIKKKLIYISGRITGIEEVDARLKFKEAEDFVNVEMEYEPLNPFDICEQNDDWKWIDYMRADIKALVDCDAILMLDNWKESDGAKLELLIAQGLKIKIYYL